MTNLTVLWRETSFKDANRSPGASLALSSKAKCTKEVSPHSKSQGALFMLPTYEIANEQAMNNYGELDSSSLLL